MDAHIRLAVEKFISWWNREQADLVHDAGIYRWAENDGLTYSSGVVLDDPNVDEPVTVTVTEQVRYIQPGMECLCGRTAIIALEDYDTTKTLFVRFDDLVPYFILLETQGDEYIIPV
jgi:hypothetical protein